MDRLLDLTGQRFGRLTVQTLVPYVRRPKWACICDCGSSLTLDGRRLRSGNTISCGCYKRERIGASKRTHGESGQNRTRLYGIWRGIIGRCNDPNNKNFKHYGARGIVVCGEWRNSYEPFRDWAVASGYRSDLTIDRIDNDGPYAPANCRWATQQEQNRNKRSLRPVVRSDGLIFQSIAEARESVGGAWDSKIVAVCRGRRKVAYGYGWRYAE